MAVLLGGVGGVGVGGGWVAGGSPTRRGAWGSSSEVWGGSSPGRGAACGASVGGGGWRGPGRFGGRGSAPLDVAHGGPPRGCRGCRGRGGLAGRGQPHSTERMAGLLGRPGGVGVGAGWLAGVSPTRRSAWRSSSGVGL